MKTARSSSSLARCSDCLRRLPRRLVSRIPARWRGAVLLTILTLLFPLWITLVLWEAVLGDDPSGAPGIEASTAQT